jgi:hypothetical protein
MGHDAAVTKRKVLGQVADCIGLVNELADDVETQAKKVNDLDRRTNAASAWCEQNSKEIAALRDVDDTFERLLKSHRAQLEAVRALLPPVGFWSRVKWLCVGPPPPVHWMDGLSRELERDGGR